MDMGILQYYNLFFVCYCLRVSFCWSLFIDKFMSSSSLLCCMQLFQISFLVCLFAVSTLSFIIAVLSCCFYACIIQSPRKSHIFRIQEYICSCDGLHTHLSGMEMNSYTRISKQPKLPTRTFACNKNKFPGTYLHAVKTGSVWRYLETRLGVKQMVKRGSRPNRSGTALAGSQAKTHRCCA